jgi:4-hydroxy-4-methyl-2-oxoglutarate aldolase
MSQTVRFDPATTSRTDFARVAPDIVAVAKGLSSATLHEAGGKLGALPSAIKPVDRGMRLCGPAFPVTSPGGDNLWLHRAIYAAQPGDILVVHASQAYEHGYWGEVMSTAAVARGLGGLIIDGCVRDGALLGDVGLPVFSRGLCIRGTGKDFGARGFLGWPVQIGEITIEPGDLIFGDVDGVVCIPREAAGATVEASLKRDREELDICRRLTAGETTMQIYGFGS